ncbi:hypothetical protein BBROOKSOX_1193 [Bathymodiolus brooksi thiotrophic gill symbiont]|nr:hypothetical protein BBROOKSOX_1193 [Bathymodiolus brooksi thiotrophic gill symbiont]
MPNEVVPLNNSTVAFASAVPEMVKPLVSLVILSLLLPVLSSSAKFKLIGAVGACVSRIKLPALLIIVLPATSVAVVLTLTTPSPKVVKSLAIKAINSVVPEAEVIFLVIAPFVPVNTTFTVLSISAVKLRTLSVASTAVLLTSPTNTTFVKVGLVVSRTIFCALLITLVLPTISVMVAVMVVVLLFELKSDLATLITAFPLVISVVDTV